MKTISQDRETQIIDSYNKRKLGQLKKRRELRKTKILLMRARFFARIFFIMLLLWGFLKVINLPQWYLDKNIFVTFPNDNLEIEGNKIVSSVQILDKLKTFKFPQKPVYLLDTKPVEKRILSLTPVKKVFIRRYWFPARLKIVLDERTPVISIAPTPKVQPVAVFTNDDGIIKVLNREFLPLPPSKETYKVLTYDQYSLWKSVQVQYIVQFADYIENATNQKLEYLDIRNPDDVFVQLNNVRLRIGRINGSTTFSNIDKAFSVLPEALKIKDEIEYIDLRWDNVSIKLKDKKKSETEAKKENTDSVN